MSEATNGVALQRCRQFLIRRPLPFPETFEILGTALLPGASPTWMSSSLQTSGVDRSISRCPFHCLPQVTALHLWGRIRGRYPLAGQYPTRRALIFLDGVLPWLPLIPKKIVMGRCSVVLTSIVSPRPRLRPAWYRGVITCHSSGPKDGWNRAARHVTQVSKPRPAIRAPLAPSLHYGEGTARSTAGCKRRTPVNRYCRVVGSGESRATAPYSL